MLTWLCCVIKTYKLFKSGFLYYSYKPGRLFAQSRGKWWTDQLNQGLLCWHLGRDRCCDEQPVALDFPDNCFLEWFRSRFLNYRLKYIKSTAILKIAFHTLAIQMFYQLRSKADPESTVQACRILRYGQRVQFFTRSYRGFLQKEKKLPQNTKP